MKLNDNVKISKTTYDYYKLISGSFADLVLKHKNNVGIIIYIDTFKASTSQRCAVKFNEKDTLNFLSGELTLITMNRNGANAN